MKRTGKVDAKAFYEGLSRVSKVLKKSSIPILGEVQARFSNGYCTLTATDLSTWVVMRVPADGDDFSFVFHHTKEVAKACRLFAGDLEIELSEAGEGPDRVLSLTLRSGERAGEFEAMPTEDYPELRSMGSGDFFICNAAELLKRVERVGYATLKPKDGTKSTSCSVQFLGKHVFALDGMRLACDTDTVLSVPRPFMTHLEPLKYLKLFGDQSVLVQLEERRGCISNGETLVVFRLTGEDVYNVDAAFASDSKETFYLSPKEALQELQYLKEFSMGAMRPFVRFCGGEMVMPTSSGKYRTRVRIEGNNEIIFAFNLHYMMDAMRQFQDESFPFPSATRKRKFQKFSASTKKHLVKSPDFLCLVKDAIPRSSH